MSEEVTKKELLELERELIELKHKYKMEEILAERDAHSHAHEQRMDEIRIKNANIQRTIMQKRESR